MPIDQVSVGEPGDGESLTFDSTAGGVGFTASKILANGVRASKAVLKLETAQCRFTIDGTTVTTTVGHLIDVGDIVTVEGAHAVRNFKCIRTGGTSGAAFATYYR